jgi:UDP-N-acetylmuramate--L-alanine ligase
MDTNLDLENILVPGAKVYFVGIGGIAMSAAANLASEAGFEVLGSDSKSVYSPAKDVLDKNQIKYFVGYDSEQLKNSAADLHVMSAGENLTNPEVDYIMKNNLSRCGLAEFLYFLSKDKLRIVVAGTHGKSTTTALLGHLLKNLDNSSFMAGGVLKNYNLNFHSGDGNYFVFEGDEYKEQFDDPTPKFHFYKPDILVLTNLEYDHPDIFSSLEELEDEFRQLIAAMPEDGLIVYNADNSNLVRLVHESNLSSVSFAIDNNADFKVENIQYGQYTNFEVINKFSKNLNAQLLGQTEDYKIQLPGKINVYNALASVATLRALGFQPQQFLLDLISFTGLKRRFEVVGVKNGVTIIDDYAHHPTAVRETLEAARLKYFSNLKPNTQNLTPKLWAVFEPHTFSRTKATLPELVKAFDAADEILISEIYPAREKISEATISSTDVIKEIKKQESGNKNQVRLVHNKQEALDILSKETKEGDVVVVMAVGDFNRLSYDLV